MKILLLGATGRTGRLILQKGIQDGHGLVAIVRDSEKIKADEAEIIQGTSYDYATVERAISGCDAVVCTLNVSRTSDSPWARLRSPKDLISKSIENSLGAMEKQGVSRIVSLSVLGAGESRKKLPFVLKAVISLSNLKHAFNDHTRLEEIMAGSDADWTAIRLPMLTDDEGESEILVNMDDEVRLNPKINRESVARFALSILDDADYFRRIVGISYK